MGSRGAEHPDPDSRSLLPFPNGWYGLAFSDELKPGRVLRRRLMGEDVVLYRTRRGVPRAVRPYCPHLGAHLGYASTVEGEDLVCTFHRFAFDTGGACVRTGNGFPPPAAARLSMLDIQEINGAVLVWWHAAGRPPRWEVPSLVEAGFPAPIKRFARLTAHPQDIIENTIDMGHFTALHGYRSARIRDLELTDERMRAEVTTRRYFPPLGALEFDFVARACGLGVNSARGVVPRLNLEVQAVFLQTPTGHGELDFRALLSLRMRDPHRVPAALRPLARAAAWPATRLVGPTMWADVLQDFPIWDHRTYLDRPRLAGGDGPIGLFRRWAAQFYEGSHETCRSYAAAPRSSAVAEHRSRSRRVGSSAEPVA